MLLTFLGFNIHQMKIMILKSMPRVKTILTSICEPTFVEFTTTTM